MPTRMVRIMLVGSGLFGVADFGRQKHQASPLSTIAMKMPAPLSIQDAKASPVAAASNATPRAILAAVATGIDESCFMVLI